MISADHCQFSLDLSCTRMIPLGMSSNFGLIGSETAESWELAALICRFSLFITGFVL